MATQQQRGVIMIIVLWVMAILTTVALTFAHQAYLDVKMTSFQLDDMRAYYLARAGNARALVYLREDRLKDAGVLFRDRITRFDTDEMGVRFDSYSEAWSCNDDYEENFARSRYEQPYGSLQVQVIDESSRLDINRVGMSGQQGMQQLWWLIYRILGEEGEKAEVAAQMIAASIIDYIDRDELPLIPENYDIVKDEFPTGDELYEQYYYNEDQSISEVDRTGGRYVLKNAPLDGTEELLAIKWVTPRLFFGEEHEEQYRLLDDEKEYAPGLKDFVTVYTGTSDGRGGASGLSNINTVSQIALEALLFPMLGEDAEDTARGVINFRDGRSRSYDPCNAKVILLQPQPFGNVLQDIQAAEGIAGHLIRLTGQASDYFEVISTGEVNGVKRELHAIVERRFIEEDLLPEFETDQRGLRNRRSRLVGDYEPEQAMISTIRQWEGRRAF